MVMLLLSSQYIRLFKFYGHATTKYYGHATTIVTIYKTILTNFVVLFYKTFFKIQGTIIKLSQKYS
jgi:hypothetical protein